MALPVAGLSQIGGEVALVIPLDQIHAVHLAPESAEMLHERPPDEAGGPGDEAPPRGINHCAPPRRSLRVSSSRPPDRRGLSREEARRAAHPTGRAGHA